MTSMNAPAIAVISSHVARGAVGNRAAVFALETLGFSVTAVPTLLLPWHPGHGAATRIVPDGEQFGDFLNDLSTGPFAGEIGAVLTGYLGAAEQAPAIAQAIGRLRARNPALIHVCDPVIGDAGGLYVSERIAEAIRDHLMPICDVCTPNRFELAWLTRRPITDRTSMIAAARQLGPARVLVTSAPASDPAVTGNALITGDSATMVWHRALRTAPSGTGDLTAALFLARLVTCRSDDTALQLATGSVIDIIDRTVARGADELTLAADATLLTTPASRPRLDIMLEPVGK